MTRTSARLAIARVIGATAGSTSRLLRRGDGVMMHGHVVTRLVPDALERLSDGRTTLLVTGTNGKTTTTAMIAAALGGDVATNATGANMRPGLTAAYSASHAPTAIMEADELHLPELIDATGPIAITVLNLSQDQMDRVLEVGAVQRRWSDAFTATTAHLIANARDPRVVAAVGDHPVTWVDPGWAWQGDASVCGRCRGVLAWSADGWSCPCGFRQPEADFSATAQGIRTPSDGVVPVDLGIPGFVNLGNAAFALAAASMLGVSLVHAAERIGAITEVSGRYREIRLGDRMATVLLAKNPAGWTAALPMLEDDDVLIVSLYARFVDGRDTSWLWNVPFERLAGRVVGVHGESRHDIAFRLALAGASVVVDDDIDRLARALPAGRLVVLGNYTAFLSFRERM